MSETGGLLIAFDGLDSTGKETQTKRLVNRLRFSGKKVLELSSPDYTTPSGQELKLRLQHKLGDWQATPWQQKMKYFAQNRAERRDELLAALKRGEIVVYDRYVPSSMAFMVVEGLPPQEIELFRKDVAHAVEREEYEYNRMPKEDISIFLDVPPEVSARLLAKRKAMTGDDAEYTDRMHVQQRLYNEYDFWCDDQPERFLRIPCVQGNELLGIEDTTELIWQLLLEKFPLLRNK